MRFPATPDAGAHGDRQAFFVERLEPQGAYYAGRTYKGNACLLIRTVGTGRTVPLVLSGLEVHFSVPCLISEPNGEQRTEVLSALVCVSRSSDIEAYFGRVCDALMEQLGALPTSEGAEKGIQSLVDLFRKLAKPSSRSLIGIAGELFAIHEATEPDIALAVWRNDVSDRFDFAAQTIRLEAKATSGKLRRHPFSIEQLNPPVGCDAFVASVFIEPLQQGFSIGELTDAIELKLSDIANVTKLRTVLADTMGEQLPVALGWRFDFQLARQSLAFFKAEDVPRLVGPAPAGVSEVKFTSDLSTSAPMKRNVWNDRRWTVA